MTEGKRVGPHDAIPDYDLDDRLELTTLAQVRAVAAPVRDAILELLLERAATVSELAIALDRPKGTIAYHVKVLLEAGVVKVVRTHRVRAVEERYYGRSARITYVGALKALDESGRPLYDNTLVTAARESGPAHDADTLSAIMRHARVPREHLRDFRQRMFELADEFSRLPRNGSETFAFVAALYPTDHPRLPDPGVRQEGGRHGEQG